jgi:two-component system sensor histidine kinase MtrB
VLRGFRGRLLVTLVGLVAVTSVVLGSGAYLFVATSLREQSLADATVQTQFNVAILAGDVLPATVAPDDPAVQSYLRAIEQRGESGAVIVFEDEERIASNSVADGVIARVSPELGALVAAGRIGFERLTIRMPGGTNEASFLVTAARRAPDGPDFYFVFDASETEAAISQLGQALLVGGVVLTGLAVVAGGALTRGVLRPVRAASSAAERIAAGDLTARLEATSRDEFGTWAASTGQSPNCAPPRTASAPSWPTCRTSFGRRSPPSSRKPSFSADTSTHSRRTGGGSASCSSGTSHVCASSSTT